MSKLKKIALSVALGAVVLVVTLCVATTSVATAGLKPVRVGPFSTSTNCNSARAWYYFRGYKVSSCYKNTIPTLPKGYYFNFWRDY